MSYERDRLVRRFVGLVLALGVIGSASPVWAWGDLGHKIVCEIALQELNDRARNEVDREDSRHQRHPAAVARSLASIPVT